MSRTKDAQPRKKGGFEPISISRKEIMESVRIPLPTQTGGVHKDRRDISRQNIKTKIKKGEWE